MKILYIYREKEKKEYSIEAVFDTVADEMKKLGHEVHKCTSLYHGSSAFARYDNCGRRNMTCII